ncbi:MULTISPECIES: MarR family transcriptional regulator [unclassified Streptomyces]|uniref:MarR family winged helix-turn-helix transcriptional regulator n=1 Tax=unclassified Streptomyces TaxID=2593676 RepID=UPI002DDBDECB|nr:MULTISPECIES: MarR family transcriptional regulator [unclassified Streptomyces]WSA91342.1 MarR family transcriptional regulator [Streptomyces sp. NBC_01795]WSB75666.1 MarR family transcriptional regulator [Streptomyces sp. NBC_01775]WSS16049.1 MarR family transcriptional regulator [Streptomyces sp. NBC_01186]WSS44869.1 MarR family transcriptional regulator [Streptomyces sp. NBC_01187]
MDAFDDPRLTATGLFLEARDGLMAKLAEPVGRAGLSVLDFDALVRLRRSPGRRLRLSDLAAQTSLSTSGITRVVDRLQRDGLARREPSPGDRRSTYAVLTDEGAARLDHILPEHLETIERCFTGLLTPGQLSDFTETLRLIRDAVHPDAGRHTEA